MNSNDPRGALRALFAVLLLALSGAAAAQQAAGRFLIAVGTVTVERGAERITAVTGTELRKGDAVVVAAQSNAQVRFNDGAVMALRPGTTLRVTEYSYQQAGQKDSGAFDLLKGGLRTVTGLLGRSNHDEYKVNTPTATIGIRGTHYVLRVCDDDCDEKSGTAQAARIYLAAAGTTASDAGPVAQAAPSASGPANGTYGTVSEGRISVANQSGERQFGADQVFHVASRSAAPQQLVAPPAFLRDRLDGRGKGERRSGQSSSGSSGGGGGSQQQQQKGEQSQSGGSQQGDQAAASTGSSSSSSGGEAAPTVAQTGQGAGNGDSRVSSGSVTPTVSLAITPTLTQVTNQVATAGPASILELTGSSANLNYRVAGTSLNIPVSCSSPPCSNIVAADLIVVVNPTSQTARYVLAFRLSDGGQLNLNSSFGDLPVVLSGTQLTINGSANSADYPNNLGSFRCSDCGPGNTAGFLASTSVSVTISNGQAVATFTGANPGETFSFTVTLPQVASLSSGAGAIAGRNIGVNGGAGVYIQLNGAGQPMFIGEPLEIGNSLSTIATATNTTVGGDVSAGNLKWGYWTGQSTGVTGNYLPYTQSAGSVSPWITGDSTNVLPASLGTASFAPVGAVIGNGAGATGALNSTSFTADFVNRTLALSINAHNGAGGTYQLSGTSAFSAINGRFSAGWSSISCTGACGTGTINGSYTGFFAGANAAGAGVAFFASNNSAIFGAVGYKKQ